MMKPILLALLLVNAILTSQAQNAHIDYGFQSGLNISSASGIHIVAGNRTPLLGLHAGGHLGIHTNKNWGYQVLLSYDQAGWKHTSVWLENSTATGLVEADILIKLHYLDLPVVAQYSFGKKVKFEIDAGLFAGILLHNSIITKLRKPIPPNQAAIPKSSSDERKTLNAGLSFGSGIRIPLASKITIDLTLRDNIGLTNIQRSASSGAGNITTNTFTVAAGLTFEM